MAHHGVQPGLNPVVSPCDQVAVSRCRPAWGHHYAELIDVELFLIRLRERLSQ